MVFVDKSRMNQGSAQKKAGILGLAGWPGKIGGYTDQTYVSCNIWYLYTTAFHWSLTQIVSGSTLC